MLNIWQGWGVTHFGRALVCGAKVERSNLINRPFADFFFFTISILAMC